MSKFELTITPDYVPNWTITDAVRELFQNALDQEATLEDNQMFFDYNEDKNVLSIGNKKSVLQIKSLLLGESTKRDDPKTIGKFGEGYKIATLVLLRLGKTVTFYNYGAKEVWSPRFVESRRYGSKILTFFVDKKHIWQSVPDNNLTIVVEGVTEKEYYDIVETNLHLQNKYDYTDTTYGQILHDEENKGKVFVNGLFVCKHEPYHKGYNFKPEYITIDRDRKLVSDFDLKWLSSQMWAKRPGAETAILARNGAPDVTYVETFLSYSSDGVSLKDNALNLFVREHGINAVPVTTQNELERVPKEFKAVIVQETYKSLIISSSSYTPPPIDEGPTLVEKFEQWFLNINNLVSTDVAEAFEELLNELREL